MISSILPFKFRFFYKELKSKEFSLLDIGCGNNSPSRTKRWFPKSKYYGLDKEVYNNTVADLRLMEKFYKIDLQRDSLRTLPNGYFDVVIISHVIEHLENGLEILAEALGKVKPGGRIYIEFPSPRSLKFPRGGLNFFDDRSHIKVCHIQEISGILLANNFRIIKSGVCSSIARKLISPIQFFRVILIQRKFTLAGLWDLFGFADFIYAVKS